MNLKNSKFFRRIQKLRRISQNRHHRKQYNHIDWSLEKAFREHSACISPQEKNCENNNNHYDDNCENKENLHWLNMEEYCENPLNLSEEMDSRNFNNWKENNCCCQKVAGENLNEEEDRDVSMPSIRSTRGNICIAHSRYSMIGRIAKSLGYKVTKDNKSWNILWTDSLPGVEIYKNMKRFQQINHFPGMMEICRKDLLSRNLNRMLKLYPKDYKIFPKTWIFPADYGEALNYAHRSSKMKTFILKPDSGAQGRGIWLTNDLKSVRPTDRMICQTYIGKPLLIDGYKFDLRVYALVTSMDPLRIFVYNEGLARFATSKYVPPSSHNNADRFMHLTNYSVNRRNSQYEMCDNDDCGSKRKFSAINNWLSSRKYNVDEFWSKIDDIIIKTILSSWPVLKHNYHACFPAHDKIQACFEILGFDILVDSKLNPYVLEVNHSPSFHTNEQVDREVKKPLIRDTLSLVSTALADRRQILREDRNRIKQRLLKLKGGSVTLGAQTPATVLPPSLGTENTTSECPLSAFAQQIAWEESHLGDFRRVMPPNDPLKSQYYCKFYGQQNQASIFAETAASKKREEASRKLRLEFENKKRKQTELVKIKLEERRYKRKTLKRNVVERNRLTTLRSQAHWTPGFITASDERLRSTCMQLRSDLVKDMKILETIYANLYKSGNLSTTDVIKFPDMFRSLENGNDISGNA